MTDDDNSKCVHREAGYPDEMQCERCFNIVPTETLRLMRVRLICPPYHDIEAWCIDCRNN